MVSAELLEPWPTGNGLLERVSRADQLKFLQFCKLVELRTGAVLHEPGAPLNNDDRPRTRGPTSASGYVDPAFSQFLVQVPDTAVRTTAQGFEDIVDGRDGLCFAVLRYREVLLRTTLQNVTCKATHTLRERCAR